MTQPPGSPTATVKRTHRPGPMPGRSALRSGAPERWTWLAAVLVIVLPIAALWPVCRHDFTSWDDNTTLRDNATLNPVTWHSLHTWWCTTKMDLYVPVTYTMWGIIAEFAHTPATPTTLGYLNPVPFHSANLVLHVLTCLAVFALLRLLIGRAWPAAAGALLFGLHPVQVEAVGWASGLKDVLSGLLMLTAVWQYLVAVRRRDGQGESGRCAAAWRSRWWGWHYGIATIAFVLAMLAKPNALMAPVLAGILDIMLVGRSWRRSAAWLGPWLVLSAAWMVVAKHVQPAIDRPLNVALIERPLVAIASIGFYVGKLLWPTNLTVDYGLKPAVMVRSPWLVGDAVVLATGAVLLWFARRRAKPMVAGAVFFVAALLPVLGFVTFDFQDYSNVADHYLYVPMFGVALMAAWAAARWRGWAMTVGSIAVLAALGGTSYSQTHYWLDSETLFEHTMEVNPDSAAAYHSLALVEIERAANATNQADANRCAEAGLRLAQQSIVLASTGEKGYIAKGMALYYLGHKDLAAEEYYKALTIDPESQPALEDLGNLLGEMGRYAEAEKLQLALVRGNPMIADDHFALALTLENEGKLPQSIAEYQVALRLNPIVPKYHDGLAEALAKSGNIPAAIHQYDIALQLDPHDANAQAGRLFWLRASHK